MSGKKTNTMKTGADHWKLGDHVVIRHSGGLRGRIFQLLGPLGPGGRQIYRVQLRRKPKPTYIEVRGDQLAPAPKDKGSSRTEECAKELFAICVDNKHYPASLERHKVYRVLPDKEAEAKGDLRVIDESGEDYLYPAEYFVLMELPREKATTLNKSLLRGA